MGDRFRKVLGLDCLVWLIRISSLRFLRATTWKAGLSPRISSHGAGLINETTEDKHRTLSGKRYEFRLESKENKRVPIGAIAIFGTDLQKGQHRE